MPLGIDDMLIRLKVVSDLPAQTDEMAVAQWLSCCGRLSLENFPGISRFS